MDMETAYAPRSKGPLGTAVRSLAHFAKVIPNHALFKRPRVRGELEVEAHNEWTLCLWAKHLATKKSKKTGKYPKQKMIESRISLAESFLPPLDTDFSSQEKHRASSTYSRQHVIRIPFKTYVRSAEESGATT